MRKISKDLKYPADQNTIIYIEKAALKELLFRS